MTNIVRPMFSYWRPLVIVLTPWLLSILFVLSTGKEMRCAYMVLVMAVYWVTEVLPAPVTSLIPVLACPLLGILSSNDICKAYMNETIMMFVGGLMFAIAVENSNLHRRIALFAVLKIGQSPRQLLTGFMITTMTLSMWISNTASTAMMIPIVDAILQRLYKTTNPDILVEVQSSNDTTAKIVSESTEDLNFSPLHKRNVDLVHSDGQESSGDNFLSDERNQNGKNTLSLHKENIILKKMYFLGTAYAANIGGTGTLMGAGINLFAKDFLDSSFSDPPGLTFASWMAFNVPGMLLCTICGWLWLQIWFIGIGKWSRIPKSTTEQEEKVRQLLRQNYDELGSFTFQEKTVLTLFIIQVLLWFFQEPGFMNGWGHLFNELFNKEIQFGGSFPSILIALVLFAIPAKPDFGWLGKKLGYDKPKSTVASTNCLTWNAVHEKMPWGIVILLGGGFAIEKATFATGLSSLIAESLRVLAVLPPASSVFVVSMATAMATEVASNSAVASLLMPALKDLSLALCVNPLFFMLPAIVCCSYAFMLPVGTPPNAIVYDATNMKTSEMMKIGFGMNIICVVIINAMINTLGIEMFDAINLPTWANSSTSGYIPSC